MKKIILFLTLAFLGGQAFAQITGGSIFVSGFGNISTRANNSEVTGGSTTITNEYPKNFSGQFGLGVGYLLTDNLAAGVNFSLNGSKNTTSDSTHSNSFGWGAGLFGRYYVPVSDNFYFFGNLGVNFNGGSSSNTSGNTETEGPKLSGMTIGIQPGFTYFPSSHFALDMSVGNLGWMMQKSTMENGGIKSVQKNSGMDVAFDLTTVFFGIQYFFGN